MEQLDEHEMLVEYSEMTSFDFDSEEFQKVRRDYLECRNFFSNAIVMLSNFFCNFKVIRNY